MLKQFSLCFINTLSLLKHCKQMINLGSITNENDKKHNEKSPYIPDHSYRILIVGGSGSGKTNIFCMQEI